MAESQVNFLVSEFMSQLNNSQKNQQLSNFVQLNGFENNRLYPAGVMTGQQGQQTTGHSQQTLYQEQQTPTRDETYDDESQQQLDDHENQQQTQTSESITEDQFRGYLIEEVRKYPCVWDTKSRGFKNSVMKRNAWLKIGAELNVGGKFLFVFFIYIFL